MAPEQAAGDPATDHRADLYALGCVALRDAHGRRTRLPAAPAAAVRRAHGRAPRALGRQRGPMCRSALAALVMRCLAKDPAARPQSAREVLTTLDGIGFTGPAVPPCPVATDVRRGRPAPLRRSRCSPLGAATAFGGPGASFRRGDPQRGG